MTLFPEEIQKHNRERDTPLLMVCYRLIAYHNAVCLVRLLWASAQCKSITRPNQEVAEPGAKGVTSCGPRRLPSLSERLESILQGSEVSCNVTILKMLGMLKCSISW